MHENKKQERILKKILNAKLGRIGTYEFLTNGKIICKLDEKKVKQSTYNEAVNKYSLKLPTLYEIKESNNLEDLNLLSIEYDISDIIFDKDVYFCSDSDTTITIKDCEFNGIVSLDCGILNLGGNIKLDDCVFIRTDQEINIFNAKLSHKRDISKNFFLSSPNTIIYNSKVNLENGYIRITKLNTISIISSTILCATIHIASIYINEFDSKIITTVSSIINCCNYDILTKIESPRIKYNGEILTHIDIQSIKLIKKLIRVLNDVRSDKYLELKKRLINDLRIIRDNVSSGIEIETKDFENSLKNQSIKRFLYKKKDKSRYD